MKDDEILAAVIIALWGNNAEHSHIAMVAMSAARLDERGKCGAALRKMGYKEAADELINSLDKADADMLNFMVGKN